MLASTGWRAATAARTRLLVFVRVSATLPSPPPARESTGVSRRMLVPAVGQRRPTTRE